MSERASLAARELKEAFDRGFAEARPPPAPAARDLLLIQVGGHPFAMRVDGLLGLWRDRPLVPLPTPMAGLLGLVGHRGGVVPVYSLAALLECASPDIPRWIAMVAAPQSLALAFDHLDRHLRLGAEASIEGESIAVNGIPVRVLDPAALYREVVRRVAVGGA